MRHQLPARAHASPHHPADALDLTCDKADNHSEADEQSYPPNTADFGDPRGYAVLPQPEGSTAAAPQAQPVLVDPSPGRTRQKPEPGTCRHAAPRRHPTPVPNSPNCSPSPDPPSTALSNAPAPPRLRRRRLLCASSHLREIFYQCGDLCGFHASRVNDLGGLVQPQPGSRVGIDVIEPSPPRAGFNGVGFNAAHQLISRGVQDNMAHRDPGVGQPRVDLLPVLVHEH